MELKPNCGSDRAWVWSTPSDFADEEQKSELLAIRFANSESKYFSSVAIEILSFSILCTTYCVCVCVCVCIHVNLHWQEGT